jgi:hypothetical protein
MKLTRRKRRCRFGGGSDGRAESSGALVPSHEANPLEPNEDHMVNVTVYTNVG